MRLARVGSGAATVGVVQEAHRWIAISSIVDGIRDGSDTVEVLGRLDEVRAALGEKGPNVASIEPDVFHSPIARPGKLIGIGLNYRNHALELGAEIPAAPIVFSKWATSLQGPSGTIRWRPDLTSQLDYEVELAVVIGARCSDITLDAAMSVVAGYAVANDVSARDAQFAEGQWVRSKSFDGACPLGPWITTVDDVADPQALRLTTDVNGERRQDSTTSEMIFDVASLVEFVARGTTLEPGDVILTGTPPGVAAATGRWLSRDDVVRCEVEGLGVLEHVVAEPNPDDREDRMDMEVPT